MIFYLMKFGKYTKNIQKRLWPQKWLRSEVSCFLPGIFAASEGFCGKAIERACLLHAVQNVVLGGGDSNILKAPKKEKHNTQHPKLKLDGV